ncbi:hypothetical protein Y002_04590 [Staphylococcus aureus MUM270]|nr:hypothetical protein Y002_04590 [Staphylococcus aureus MUM270]
MINVLLFFVMMKNLFLLIEKIVIYIVFKEKK